MRRKFVVLMFPVLAVFLTAATSEYKKWVFLGNGVYSEKIISDDAWKIETNSSSDDPKNFALNAAIYRSAIRARAGGFQILHITRMDVTMQEMSRNSWHQNVVMKAKATSDPGLPVACEYKPENPKTALCRAFQVDEVLARLGPIIGQTSQQAEVEIRELHNAPTPK